MLGQHFEDHGQVGVALAMTEDRGASHFVQGFENDVTVLVGKLAENVGASADQGRRCALRKLSGEELLVAVAQALWTVDHQRSRLFRQFQQIGCVDVLAVEWRILAHEDHIEVGKGHVDLLACLEPVLRVVEDLQRAHACAGLVAELIKVSLLHIEECPASRLGGQQHGKRAVLLEGDLRDRVHDDPDANGHESFSSYGRQRAAGGAKGRCRLAVVVHWVKENPDAFPVDSVARRSVLKRSGDWVQPIGGRASGALT